MELATFLGIEAAVIGIGILFSILIPKSFFTPEKGKAYYFRKFSLIKRAIFIDDHEHLNDPDKPYYDPNFDIFVFLPNEWGKPEDRKIGGQDSFYWPKEKVTKKITVTIPEEERSPFKRIKTYWSSFRNKESKVSAIVTNGITHYKEEYQSSLVWIGLFPFWNIVTHVVKKNYKKPANYQVNEEAGEIEELRTDLFTIISVSTVSNHIRPQSELLFYVIDAETGDKIQGDNQGIQGIPISLWGLATMRAYDGIKMLTRNVDYISIFLKAVTSVARDTAGDLTYEKIVSSQNEHATKDSLVSRMQVINQDTEGGNPSLIKLNGLGFLKANIEQVVITGTLAKELLAASTKAYIEEQNALAATHEANAALVKGKVENDLVEDRLKKEGDGRAAALNAETTALVKREEELGNAKNKILQNQPPDPNVVAKWQNLSKSKLTTYIEADPGKDQKTNLLITQK